MTKEVKTAELKLGDVVRVHGDAYGTAHVTRITQDVVEFSRPYGSCADFSMSAGEEGASQVIFYTGLEVFTVFRLSDHVWKVYHGNNLK